MNKKKTFDEWKKLGYIVKKGEHSKIKNKDGKCLFYSSQVSEIKRIYDRN